MTAARKMVHDVISDTPVLHSRVLSEALAGPVFLKCENLQRTGSFKVRGAYNRISRLSDAERARGVVAASAGNHAQGVAFAAGHLGCAATVVMPEGVSQGLLLCLERAKQVVEPAGAAGVAALLEHARDFVPPVVVLSGGNIDPLLLAKLLRHGLTAAGRYLAFRCRLPDRPGSLAKLLGDLADLGANVLEVAHERLAPRLHVDEAEVVLQVETRGPEHCAEVIGALRAVGYTLAFA